MTPIPKAAAIRTAAALPASIAPMSRVRSAENRAEATSSGRVGPNRSMSRPWATDPIETPTRVPAETRPATAKSCVRCCTYNRADSPIIAIGNRASAEAATGPRASGVLRATR